MRVEREIEILQRKSLQEDETSKCVFVCVF